MGYRILMRVPLEMPSTLLNVAAQDLTFRSSFPACAWRRKFGCVSLTLVGDRYRSSRRHSCSRKLDIVKDVPQHGDGHIDFRTGGVRELKTLVQSSHVEMAQAACRLCLDIGLGNTIFKISTLVARAPKQNRSPLPSLNAVHLETTIP